MRGFFSSARGGANEIGGGRCGPMVWAAASIGCAVLLSGCPNKGTKGGSSTSPRPTSRGSECPQLTAATVRIASPRQYLPPIPAARPFSDPEPVPEDISLKRLRRRASRYLRAKRWKANAQLASLLWRMAHKKTRLAHRLEKLGRAKKKRVVLEREAHAHLRECVALLEQVLTEKPGFYLALLRLAYYLRDLRPKEAIAYFRKLVDHPKSAGRRDDLRESLSRLILAYGSGKRALEVASRIQKKESARVEYIKAGAAFRARKLDSAADHLLRAAERTQEAPMRMMVRAALPHFLAMAPSPAKKLEPWLAGSEKWWASARDDLVEKLRQQLMELGRTDALKRVEKVAGVAAAGSSEKAKNEVRSFRDCVKRLSRRARYCLLREGVELGRPKGGGKRAGPRGDGRAVIASFEVGGVGKKTACGLEGLDHPAAGRVGRCLCEELVACADRLKRPRRCKRALPAIRIHVEAAGSS